MYVYLWVYGIDVDDQRQQCQVAVSLEQAHKTDFFRGKISILIYVTCFNRQEDK